MSLRCANCGTALNHDLDAQLVEPCSCLGMTMNDYQAAAAQTAIYPGRLKVEGVLYCALGVSGEAGEVAGRVKKILRDDKIDPSRPSSLVPEDKRTAIKRQLGDVLWYISQLAEELGVPLETIAQENLAKLAPRQERNVLSGQGDGR